MAIEEELENSIKARYPEYSTRRTMAELALGKIKEGMADLEPLGVRLVVSYAPEDTAAPVEFPRMLYKKDEYGNVSDVTAHSPEEQDELEASGWKDHA